MYYLYEVSKIEDFEPFYLMKCQKDAIKWSGFDTAPDKERLRQYFIDRILNNDRTHVFYMKDTESDDAVVGYKQYDDIDETTIEIRGTIIFKRFQGCGLNEEFGRLLGEHFVKRGIKRLVTYVSEQNKVSVANVIYSGFKKTEKFEDREMKALGQVHRFYKWICEIK